MIIFRLVFILFFCLQSTCLQAAVRIIPLKYQTPDNIIKLLTPLNPPVQFSGNTGVILLKGNEKEVLQWGEIIENLDKPLKQLLISIRMGDDPRLSDNKGSIKTYETTGPNKRSVTQTIEVQEGETAYLQTDQAIPVLSLSPSFLLGSGAIDYQVLANTLSITPYAQADSALVLIKKRQENRDQFGQTAIDGQGFQTQIRLPFGQWKAISSFQNLPDQDSKTRLYQSGRPQEVQGNVWIKVEVESQ